MAENFHYHPYLFNPLYWHLRKYLKDPNIRYIFIEGGSSAAKTYSITQAFMLHQLEHKINIISYRKESTTIDDTIYSDYETVAKQLELDDELQFIRRKVRAKDRSFKTTFKGLDDPEKQKGISSYDFAYLNEVSKFDYEDFDEISRRLRGRPGQKIICDWNPIDENHWIYTNVIDKMVDDVPTEKWHNLPIEVDDAPTVFSKLDPRYSYVKINESGNSILIKTTYRDNYWVVGHPIDNRYGFVDKHTIANFEYYKTLKNQYYYNVYANGERGSFRTGTEFFDEFNQSVHVTDDYTYHDETRAIAISLDFNRLPYSTCLLRQLIRREDGTLDFIVFDEICLPPPSNSVEDIRDEIFRRHSWIKAIFYGGDPSGRAKGQKKSRDEADSYEDAVKKAFAKWAHNGSNIWLNYAPPKANRHYAFTQVLTGKLCRLIIYRRCKNLINDYNKLLISQEGGWIKQRVTDKNTGATYEKDGHAMDAHLYDLATVFPREFFPR